MPSSKPSYPNGTCGDTCHPLAANEWLANADYWNVEGADIAAASDTYLKKSLMDSDELPAAEKHFAKKGATCSLVVHDQGQGYYLCMLGA